MTGELLVGRGLRHAFGSTEALRGVDLTLAEGEVLAVTGPSGSGKSTLLHCLAGVLRPREGQVVLRDTTVSDLDDGERAAVRRRDIGLVLQFGQLVGELSALENVALPLLLEGRGRRDAAETAAGWLDRLDVGNVLDQRPGAMSGGQRQRVAVARALVCSPAVVLADEPTGALDTVAGEAVMAVLREAVAESGAGLLVVTHDHRVAAVADREVALRDGLVASPDGVAR